MSTVWHILVVAACIGTLLNLVLVVGLLRRTADLLEAIADGRVKNDSANSNGPAFQEGLAPGATVGEFWLLDDLGIAHRYRDVVDGQAVLLFLDQHCQPCAGLIDELNLRPWRSDIKLIVIADDHLEGLSSASDWGGRLYLQTDSAASRAFRTNITPHAFAVADAFILNKQIPSSIADLERWAGDLFHEAARLEKA